MVAVFVLALFELISDAAQRVRRHFSTVLRDGPMKLISTSHLMPVSSPSIRSLTPFALAILHHRLGPRQRAFFMLAVAHNCPILWCVFFVTVNGKTCTFEPLLLW
jgi:hypothetical protein